MSKNIEKKSISVVYIITKLELGGAQKICLSLFDELQGQGSTTYLISGAEGPLVKQVQKNERAILLGDMKRELTPSGVLKELRNFFNLIGTLRKLKQKNPNLIVHTHSTKAGLLGRWAAWCARIKTRVHTVHGYGFHTHQNLLVWFGIYCLEFVTSLITTHFVCVSSADIKTGIKLFPQFEKKSSIIRAAVPSKEFYIPATKITEIEQKKEFIFGTVACFKKQKNLFDLLKAFNKVSLKNKTARLEIIGDGALRPALEEWIQSNKLESKITLHGWQDSVASTMIHWNCFVLSSLWEGLPCAIIEARLLKLPVLSYNTGGIHDVIKHGDNGYLYPQGHWGDLADGMLELITNRPLYTKMRSHKENLSEFDNKTMISQHLELYQQLS